MFRKELSYYIKGFKLLNKNLDLFFFGILLSLGNYLLLFGYRINPLVSILLTVIFVIYYTFVIVILLNNRIDNVRMTPKYIYYLFIELLKRLSPWIILIFILFLIVLTVIGVVAVISVGSGYQIENYYAVFKNQLIIFSFIISIFGPALRYMPIFFGIKNYSFFDSIKRSLRFTIKNFKFTYLIFPLIIVSQALNLNFYNILEKNSILQIGFGIVNNYINLIIISASLIYILDIGKNELTETKKVEDYKQSK